MVFQTWSTRINVWANLIYCYERRIWQYLHTTFFSGKEHTRKITTVRRRELNGRVKKKLAAILSSDVKSRSEFSILIKILCRSNKLIKWFFVSTFVRKERCRFIYQTCPRLSRGPRKSSLVTFEFMNVYNLTKEQA